MQENTYSVSLFLITVKKHLRKATHEEKTFSSQFGRIKEMAPALAQLWWGPFRSHHIMAGHSMAGSSVGGRNHITKQDAKKKRRGQAYSLDDNLLRRTKQDPSRTTFIFSKDIPSMTSHWSPPLKDPTSQPHTENHSTCLPCWMMWETPALMTVLLHPSQSSLYLGSSPLPADPLRRGPSWASNTLPILLCTL